MITVAIRRPRDFQGNERIKFEKLMGQKCPTRWVGFDPLPDFARTRLAKLRTPYPSIGARLWAYALEMPVDIGPWAINS
jgi:hypothetical protein